MIRWLLPVLLVLVMLAMLTSMALGLMNGCRLSQGLVNEGNAVRTTPTPHP